jgi:putative hydrolase of the HAD superfamily
VIAAGVAAYRETSSAYLKPYAETFPTLLKLRETGHKVGVVTDGRAVKQWQKLIQLGIYHLVDGVVTPEEIGAQTMKTELFRSILKDISAQTRETVFVASKLEPDIYYAKKAKILSIRMRRGQHRTDEPKSTTESPDFEIDKLSEVFSVLEKIGKTSRAKRRD